MQEIDKTEVWGHLTAKRTVYAVVFKSKCWREGMKNLQLLPVMDVNAYLADNESEIRYFTESEGKE